MKFVINPGHGGSDPGACGNGLREKDLNLAVALAMVPLLTARGIDVHLTRTGDTYRSLQQRSNFIVGVKPDAALDLHHNGASDPKARGIETFRSLFNPKSRALAEKVHPQLLSTLGMPDRKIKTRLYPGRNDWDYYRMIREPHRKAGIPVIITETGFVSSPADAAIMKRADFAAKQAEALARGICAFFGVPWSSGGSDGSVDRTQLYRVQIGAFREKENAEALAAKAEGDGYDVYIVPPEGGVPAPPPPKPAPKPEPSLKVGSKVRVKKGAKDYNGVQLASFVYGRTYDVIQIAGDRVVIGEGGIVTAAVRKKDLIPV